MINSITNSRLRIHHAKLDYFSIDNPLSSPSSSHHYAAFDIPRTSWTKVEKVTATNLLLSHYFQVIVVKSANVSSSFPVAVVEAGVLVSDSAFIGYLAQIKMCYVRSD